MKTEEIIKPSKILLEAWVAAEKALPESSLKLITEYDALHRAWREAGYPNPLPDLLKAADDRIMADPLARIAFELRKQTNTAAAEEWRAEHP